MVNFFFIEIYILCIFLNFISIISNNSLRCIFNCLFT